MIKRLISLVLVGLMSITMLTGCGINDLGYLNLSKEISNMTEFKFENSTHIEASKELADKDYNLDIQLSGVANLQNLNSIYLSFDLLFKLNDIGVEKPINFKIVDNKLYVAKTALLEVIALEEEINGTTGYKNVIHELYKNDLKNIEYILLTDLGTTYKDTTYKEMSEKGIDYLKSAFKGFDTKLITKTAKGYSLELNSEAVLSFVKNLFKYLSENKELVFDETVKYVEELYSNIETEDLTEEQKQEMLKELRDSRQDFYDFVDEGLVVLNSGELDGYVDIIKGSKIKEELSKDGNTYKDISSAELVYDGIAVGKAVSNTTITPIKVEKTAIIGGVIAAEDLQVLFDKVENRINPVKSMELEWYDESYDVQVKRVRLEGNSDFDFQSYTIIDGRIYLPLRYICESFGEEVQWDNETAKAYIIRGAEKIDMTGIIMDSSTMIKVKDFEKLGYKIGYTQVEGLSTATIEK